VNRGVLFVLFFLTVGRNFWNGCSRVHGTREHPPITNQLDYHHNFFFSSFCLAEAKKEKKKSEEKLTSGKDKKSCGGSLADNNSDCKVTTASLFACLRP